MVFRFFTFAAVAAFSVLGAQATPTPQQCNINNVCYVIDQSASIGSTEYQQEQNFVVRISNEIETIAVNDPFNSAVAFSGNAQTIQDPTQDLTAFQASVGGNRFFNGGTVISTGLNQCRTLLEGAQGNRVIALITDGQTAFSDIPASNQAATDAKAAEIDIVTVGIGSHVSQDFLMDLASDPSLFINANFDDLDQKIPEVVQAICDAVDPPTPCEIAFEECEFTFSEQRGLTAFDISGEPDTAFTTRVVPKDVSYGLGTLNTNNIVPEFIDDSDARPITEFGSQRFTPTHFKPFWIMQERGSGIGHQTFQGDQAQVARDKCIRIFFTSFQEIRENRVVNRNNVPRSANKCVVFRTM